MSHQALLAAMRPPVSYDTVGETAEIKAEAGVFDIVADHAEGVKNAPFPDAGNDYLYRWEELLAITPPAGANTQQRTDAVLAKLNALGGLSIAYFTAIAESAGYTVNIYEEDQFRAGESCAGDFLNTEDAIWRWCVDISDGKATAYIFRAGQSRAGDRISVYTDPIIETMFEELKPAWTYCRFEYDEEV